jgi:hypothetical protein
LTKVILSNIMALLFMVKKGSEEAGKSIY